MNKTICIITSYGGKYGTGHLQRMVHLHDTLSARGIDVSVCLSDAPDNMDPPVDCIYVHDIPLDATCIIRDMRDSSRDDIIELKKIAPVIVIDDCGEGRTHADRAIDCLPNLLHPESVRALNESPFLFGLSFTSALEMMPNADIAKDIDLTIYIGHNPEQTLIDSLLSCVPDSFTVCVTGMGQPFLAQNPQLLKEPRTFTDALVRSQRVCTHFGLTLFEAAACGCTLLTINPTQYHNDLCEKASGLMTLTNLGMITDIDGEKIRKTLAGMQNTAPMQINIRTIKKTVEQCSDNFFSLLTPYL